MARAKKVPVVAAPVVKAVDLPLCPDPGPGVYDISLRITRPTAVTGSPLLWEGIVQVVTGRGRPQANSLAIVEAARRVSELSQLSGTYVQVVGSTKVDELPTDELAA